MKVPRLAFLNAPSFANVQGIASIPSVRLERKLGVLPSGTIAEMRKALTFALDLGGASALKHVASNGLPFDY